MLWVWNITGSWGCKDIGIGKFEYMAKTQFLFVWQLFAFMDYCMG